MSSKRSKAGKEKEGSSGALILLLLGLGCGGLIAMSPDLGVPLVILMLPGLILLMVDASPGWGVARAMLLFQAAACVHPIADAWYQCSGVDACTEFLAMPTTLTRVWLAGGLGWLLTQLLPIGLRLLNDARLRRYRVLLETRRDALRTEWGLDGAQTDP